LYDFILPNLSYFESGMPCDTSATEMTLIKNGIIRWKSHLDIFGGMSFG